MNKFKENGAKDLLAEKMTKAVKPIVIIKKDKKKKKEE